MGFHPVVENLHRKDTAPAAQPPGRQAVTQVHVPVMVTGQPGTMNARSRYPPSADASGQQQLVTVDESGRSMSKTSGAEGIRLG